MKVAFILLLTTMCFQAAMAGTSKSITFMWEWGRGGSGHTSGPNMDVAYDLYMRTEYDSSYAYDYPLISGIDNCWWNHDRYSCQTTLDYEFTRGVSYHFAVVAYLVEDPNQRSAPSNEVEYSPGSSSGGGGCFITSGMEITFDLP